MSAAVAIPLPPTNPLKTNGYLATSPGDGISISSSPFGSLTDHNSFGTTRKSRCGSLVKVKNDFHIPLELLSGEYILEHYVNNDNQLLLSNYRLFQCTSQNFSNIPVRCIDYVELRELFSLLVYCKDGKIIRLCFETEEEASEWWRHITSCEATLTSAEELFAYHYFNKITCSGQYEIIVKPSSSCEAGMFVEDYRRMGFNSNVDSVWRITDINAKFEVCKTYPKFHIIPKSISDEDLKTIAKFRSLRRFPSVVWRNQKNGAVIARSSQPELGWFGWRCEKDEKLLSAIACAAELDAPRNEIVDMALSVNNVDQHHSQQFLLVDARSYAAAVANRAKGGGCECQEYYPNCEILFMGLPNIHAIRASFQKLRRLCYAGRENLTWYTELEATKWLHHVASLLRATGTIVEAVGVNGQSALVHCSDGWDRTPQLVSLAQLLLDPYYRTIKGFYVLLEREWLEFGHKFADRCGHSAERDMNEKSPVFLQWLDAVHQMHKQHPSAFQFNEFFILKLAQHVYSCLYGTFLYNNAKERLDNNVKQKTVGVWEMLLKPDRKDFINLLYSITSETLYPSWQLKDLCLWESLFMSTVQNFTASKPRELSADVIKDFNDSGNYTSSSNETRKNDPSPRSLPDLSSDKMKSNADTIGDEIYLEKLNLDAKLEITGSSSNGNAVELENFKNESGPSCDNGKINSEKESSGEILNKECSSKNNDSRDNYREFQRSNSEDEGMRKSLTDSALTLTPESEHTTRRKSFDESKNLDLDHNKNNGVVTGSNGVIRRTHSSPESPPTTPRLHRPKSVPDVMSASMGSPGSHKLPPELCKQHQFPKDLNQFLDVDGSTLTLNFYEQHLVKLERKHQMEIDKLKRKLELERQARVYLQQQHFNGSPHVYPDLDDQISVTDSGGSSSAAERNSVSSNDCEGWEQVQFDDVEPVRWVPDLLSPFCSNCGSKFTVVYRKHHCRKCGGIFCDTCSRHQISLPEESYYTPVRVCARCYGHAEAG